VVISRGLALWAINILYHQHFQNSNRNYCKKYISIYIYNFQKFYWSISFMVYVAD